MDWTEWLQNAGTTLLTTGADVYKTNVNNNAQIQMANQNNLAQLRAMQLQFSPFGQPYIEGQAGVSGANPIPLTWLLIGGAILAVVLVKN